jgi:flagellar basal body-associated protein FliL
MSKKTLKIAIISVVILAILAALGYFIYQNNSQIKPLPEVDQAQLKTTQQQQVVSKVVADGRLIKINSEIHFDFMLKKDINLTAFDNQKLSKLVKDNYEINISKYYGKYVTVRTADTIVKDATDPNNQGNLTYVFVFAEEELVYSGTIPDSQESVEFSNLVKVCAQLQKEFGIPSPTPSPTPTPKEDVVEEDTTEGEVDLQTEPQEVPAE